MVFLLLVRKFLQQELVSPRLVGLLQLVPAPQEPAPRSILPSVYFSSSKICLKGFRLTTGKVSVASASTGFDSST